MKKERSFSGGISDTPGSPGSVRKKNETRPNISSGKLRAPPPPLLSVSADTVFYIPGLDVKVHYSNIIKIKIMQHNTLEHFSTFSYILILELLDDFDLAVHM